MQSSDDTVALAKMANARVVEVPDARVIEEVRQWGLDAATTDWVLFVDADEILPPGFAEHVRRMTESDETDQTVAYRLRYSNVAFDRVLRHTLVGSAKYSLMRRGFAHYESPARAHIPPVFDGLVRDAPQEVPPVLHLNFRSAAQMTEKTLRYAADHEGEIDLLRPSRLLRELLRASVFSGSWADGYAGSAVATSSIFGRWYGALLTADQSGLLKQDLPESETRRLRSLSRLQKTLLGLRDRLRGIGRRVMSFRRPVGRA
jgi:hypothetical protein